MNKADATAATAAASWGWRVLRTLTTLVVLAAIVLWLAQERAPDFWSSAKVSDAVGDQALLATIAALPDFDAHMQAATGTLTAPLARGATLLEFFRLSDQTRFRTLRHASPVVRAYAALHLLRTAPLTARLLRPLLADGTPLALAEFGDPRGLTTVATATLAMLCARSQQPDVRHFLEEVAADARLVASWRDARRCLRDNEGTPAG